MRKRPLPHASRMPTGDGSAQAPLARSTPVAEGGEVPDVCFELHKKVPPTRHRAFYSASHAPNSQPLE